MSRFGFLGLHLRPFLDLDRTKRKETDAGGYARSSHSQVKSYPTLYRIIALKEYSLLSVSGARRGADLFQILGTVLNKLHTSLNRDIRLKRYYAPLGFVTQYFSGTGHTGSSLIWRFIIDFIHNLKLRRRCKWKARVVRVVGSRDYSPKPGIVSIC